MAEFDYGKRSDPGFFQENRLNHRGDYVWYQNEEEFEEGESSFRLSLDGLWKFHYARNLQTAVKDFWKTDYDCSDWEDIRVPAHIQMEGFGVPQYANVQYPWEGHEELSFDEIPVRFNPVASYVKYFELPKTWDGKPVYISLQGAESAAALWINDSYVGYSGDSFSPADFDLTPYVKEGVNKLSIQVFQWTAGSWCEDQDFFRFSGLFRSVYLYTVPRIHFEDIHIRADVSEDLVEGRLKIEGKMAFKNAEGKVRITCRQKGEVLWQEEKDAEEHYAWEWSFHNPSLWSAEKPNLYEVVFEVLDETGSVLEWIHQNVGFRRFEMKNGIMCINGKRIVFRGVNRHEFSHLTGRSVTKDEVIRDLIIMKRHNINAIRTSHYPNDWMLYELCDIYGLYVIAETNMETHGTWPEGEAIKNPDWNTILPCDHEEWEPMLLDRCAGNYEKNKNHPCILIWSLGNESFGGRVIFHMAEYFRNKDNSRLIHYEGIHNDRRYPGSSDMESRMYTKTTEIEAWLKEHPEKPYICCEYTHAMGNSCGAMHKYTELTERNPKYQGGFIWDFVDQAIKKKDRYGKPFMAYGGDFHDRPCDYNFSGDGIVFADRSLSPKMQEVKYNYQDIRCAITKEAIRIRNYSLFTDTGEYETEVILLADGKEKIRTKLQTQVEPGEEKEYSMPKKIRAELAKEAAEYCVEVRFLLREDTLFAGRGYEMMHAQEVFGAYCEKPAIANKNTALAKASVSGRKKFHVVHSSRNIGIYGEHFDVIFSYAKGLVSYRYGGRELIESIPMPNFWRAPIDNDLGNQMPYRYAQWKVAGAYSVIKGMPKIEEKEGSVSLTYTYQLATNPASECRLTWSVSEEGTIHGTLEYEPEKELKDMPEFGVMMKLSADYDHLTWYGMGPEETYVDRVHGARLGIYHGMVEKQTAPYLMPQESGNHIGVRWAEITDEKGRGLRVMGDRIHVSALPWTPGELENAMHPFELPPIHYTVLRMAKAQMGIGGDDSWGARTHEEYLIDVTEPLKFEFAFRGI